jgi:hypothetical protein
MSRPKKEKATERANELLQAIMEKRSEWMGPAFSFMIQRGFDSLRKYVEDPNEPDITWQNPFTEIRYPAPWDWGNYRDAGYHLAQTDWGFELAGLLGRANDQWRDLLLDLIVQDSVRSAMGSAAYLLRDGKVLTLLPQDQHNEITNLDEQARSTRLDELYKPLPIYGPKAFELDGNNSDNHDFVITPKMEIHPLVVNEDEGTAYFPFITGLSVTTSDGSPAELPDLDPEDAAKIWRSIDEALERQWPTPLLEIIANIIQSQTKPVNPQGSVPDVRPAPLAGYPTGAPSRFLLEGSTMRDSRAIGLINHVEKISLPRKWSTIKRWENLEQEEIRRIQEVHGAKAFQSGLLSRRFRRGFGDVIELTQESEQTLMDGLASKPFRKVIPDEDGVRREYLVKQIKTSGGLLEIRLSWYGQAWPLVSEAREKEYDRLSEIKKRQDGLLFEELTHDEQERLDGRLRFLESIRDGREVMEHILNVFGRDASNPVRIPAYEFWSLLECETDDHRHTRVMGCLRALQEIRFRLKATGSGDGFHAFGPFLGEVSFDPGGVGGHRDGTFYLQVADSFVGCLRVFGSSTQRIKNARGILSYEWGKNLSPDQRKDLGEAGFVKGFSALAPFHDRAKGFSDHQKRLRQWIEKELTLKKDGVRRGRESIRVRPNANEATEPRLYDRSFCPLLPEAYEFNGALCHFKTNPESGRKLYGSGSAGTSRSGANTAGLMHVMGYSVPTGKARSQRAKLVKAALQDLRAVVEEAMGGVVAAWHGQEKRWLTLAEAATLNEDQLGKKVTWFLFPAADWRDRLNRDLEQYHAKRYEEELSPYLIRVTNNRATYDRSEEERQGVRYGLAADEANDSQPLHTRMRTKRLETNLSQAVVGKSFGVSAMTISVWERGPQPDEEGRRGKQIPAEMAPFVLRWLETGQTPSKEELASRKTARKGIKKDSPETSNRPPD